MNSPDLAPDLGPSGTNPWPARSTIAWSAVGVFAVFVASHWSTLAMLVERWSTEPQYSHGFVVPLFAVVVLWSRLAILKDAAWQPAWTGVLLLAIGLILRYLAVQSDIEPLDGISLLPTVFGLVLLICGWAVLNWAWPALAFLAFMLPLPYTVEVSLAYPLRRIATEMSTYALQTLGCPALAEGNIIFVDEIPLGVENACSGLGMLMTFFALATAMAMIVKASLVERAILTLSAIPIAIIANVLRISVTGLAYHLCGRESNLAQVIYHDLAGWFMMPMAVLMLWVELKFLQNLFIDYADDEPLKPTFDHLPTRVSQGTAAGAIAK